MDSAGKNVQNSKIVEPPVMDLAAENSKGMYHLLDLISKYGAMVTVTNFEMHR